ncbi:tRNA (Guanine-1)-methyltransferase [Gracilaria domingensis]|nr:tRNA (Guanine-1)-methyltransferase [Gracilaria domingensis]
MGATFSQLFRPNEQGTELLNSDQETAPQDRPQEQLSKKARKKIARERRLQERKEVRKAKRRELKVKEKIRKRQEREEALKHFTADQREELLRERVEHMRAGRAAERAKKAHVRDILVNESKYNVCIDLGWNSQMFEKERKSLARQLAYSYSTLRKCAEEGRTPLRLSIVGIDKDIKPILSFAAQGWESWPLQLCEKSLELVHDRRRLVYLTHDAEDVLETLNTSDIYVIGGLVDRNRLKGATRLKAESLSIRSARLNLDANISIQHGTPVLTVNHCVEILLHVANGTSWKDAYMRVLPERKGIKSC